MDEVEADEFQTMGHATMGIDLKYPKLPVPRHVQAAKASLLAPLISVIVNTLLTKNSDDRSVALVIGVCAGILIFVGFVFALWGIVGAIRKGPLRTLLPAVCGLVINGTLVFAAISGILAAAKLAEEHRANDAAIASDDWVPTDEGWYVDRRTGFAIRFPVEWEVQPYPVDGLAVAALNPPQSQDDVFVEQINVVTRLLPPGVTPEGFVSNDLDDLRRSTVDYVEHGVGTRTINGTDWTWVDYEHEVEGTRIRTLGVSAVRHGRVFVTSCIGLSDEFDLNKTTFDRVIDSIRTP
jgi:hypothetical protein